MSEIQAIAYLKIYEGKLDEFKSVADKCMQIVREKDTGTLQYDWFLSNDNSECQVIERYKDSDAVLDHMTNLGETLGELLSLVDLSLTLYGNPSEKLMAATEGLEISFYKPLS